MADKLKVYWDACLWFALIKREAGRIERVEHVLELARRGEVEIWTSSLTLAEVFKKQCGAPGTQHTGLLEAEDRSFEEFLAQDFVVEVQLDHRIGIEARRLLRKHMALKKPQDAAHLASATLADLDEFHTFDTVNLLPLNGLIFTSAGRALKICQPPALPPDLFTLASNGADEEVAAQEIAQDAAAAAAAAASVEAMIAPSAPGKPNGSGVPVSTPLASVEQTSSTLGRRSSVEAPSEPVASNHATVAQASPMPGASATQSLVPQAPARPAQIPGQGGGTNEGV